MLKKFWSERNFYLSYNQEIEMIFKYKNNTLIIKNKKIKSYYIENIRKTKIIVLEPLRKIRKLRNS